jgi:poly-beta-1,6-N-acetyl-D-glucosamine synthase
MDQYQASIASAGEDMIDAIKNQTEKTAIATPADPEGRAELKPCRYVLITAAYNEEGYIEKTIQAVVAQSVLPLRWAIVSDGSTDRTDEIVLSYAARYPFIQLVRIQEKHARNFAAQVNAIALGCKSLQALDYRFIANLDADISFEPTYYARLMQKFSEDPDLGLAGGCVCEEKDGVFVSRSGNREYSVPHAVQMFRRECFESVGGYLALPYGGPDWHAIVVARMRGWGVKAFADLPVNHHRPTGGADRIMRHWFRQGRMDYSLGSYPPFEILKLARRIPSKPFLLGALARLCGFIWCYCLLEKRPVSQEFIDFIRIEQKNAMRSLFLMSPIKETVQRCTAEPARSTAVHSDEPPVSHNV